MRLYIGDDATRREVLEALCRLPEDVRRFALEHVTFLGVGRARNGLALSPGLAGAWVVVLAERPCAGATAAHELAHAMLGHDSASAENERAAASLAAHWGVSGASADPDRCAAAFSAAQEATPAMRVHVAGSLLDLHCRCGTRCEALAPVVPGRAAVVGGWCPSCSRLGECDLALLAPCTCGHVRVTWAEGATPERPVATYACGCGTATYRLREARPEPPDREAWLLARATQALMQAEEALRRDSGDLALEVCRVELLRTRRTVLMLAGERPESDPARRLLTEAAGDLASATLALGEGDSTEAADLAAGACRVLDNVLAEMAAAPAGSV